MDIKFHIFNKTYLSLLEIQLSQMFWRKDLKRQDFCKEWKTSLRWYFFFTANLATNLNIYSWTRIALLKHQTPFHKPLMTSSETFSLNTSEKFSACFLPYYCLFKQIVIKAFKASTWVQQKNYFLARNVCQTLIHFSASAYHCSFQTTRFNTCALNKWQQICSQTSDSFWA